MTDKLLTEQVAKLEKLVKNLSQTVRVQQDELVDLRRKFIKQNAQLSTLKRKP